MWIFLKNGFYSIVQKPDDGPNYLTVRTRTLADAEYIRDTLKSDVIPHDPEWEIKHTPANDYPYRLRVSRFALVRLMELEIHSLRYSNFKATQPEVRQRIYHQVWAVLLRLTGLEQTPPRLPKDDLNPWDR